MRPAGAGGRTENATDWIAAKLMSPLNPALCVHLLTASGAGLGLAALFCAVEGRFSEAFAWLGVAFIVDAVDGPLARRLDVQRNAARFDGVVLDLVVDFLTYVIVPLVALWRAELLAPALAGPLCAAIASLSALYFGDRTMKTEDNWFRGFPAVWNVLVFYLLIFWPPPLVAFAVMVVAAGLMFAPVVFVHPLRVRRLRSVTLMMTGVWGMAAVAAAWQGLDGVTMEVKAALAVTAAYFSLLALLRG